MKKATVVRDYFVLPCCLLLLNLCNSIVTYKAGTIRDGMIRTAFVIAMVLFGSSVVAFLVSPSISAFIGWMHRTSRRSAGRLGEIVFLAVLGVVIFWIYYRLSSFGPASVLPAGWRNPSARH